MASAPISFQAKIIAALGGMHREVALPDSKHNQGRMLAEAFFWDTVVDYARKQADKAWEAMEKNNVIPDEEDRRDRKKLDVGEHVLAESPRFSCKAVVTKPVKRFQVAALAKILAQKHKIPVPTTTEYCEAAKVEGASQVRLAIEEKGV